jgi:dCTP deaminase
MGILPDWMIQRDVKIDPLVVYNKVEQKGRISYGLSGYGYDARISENFSVFSPINSTEIDPKNFDPKALVKPEIHSDKKMISHSWKVIRPSNMRQPALSSCEFCGTETTTPESTVYCYNESWDKGFIRIPPHSFVLGETVETFTIPRDVLCLVVGKSTYARCGLIINVTPGEPEWTGKWTIEMSNTTDLPVRVYVNEGIMQCVFVRTDGLREANSFALVRMLEELGRNSTTMCSIQDNFVKAVSEAECKVSYADKKGKYQSQTGLTLPKAGE